MVRGKKGDHAFIILTVVVIIATIVGVIIKTNIAPSKETSGQWSAVEESNTIPNSSSNTIRGGGETKKNSSQELVVVSSEVGGGGGGGGGGGKTQTYTSPPTPVCTSTRPASYSIITLNHSQKCNEYDGDYCINKDVVCLAKLKSDDALISMYDIELIFVENGKPKDTDSFGTLSSYYVLNPFQSIVVEGKTNIVSTGEEGLANQLINCFFNTVGNPKACMN